MKIGCKRCGTYEKHEACPDCGKVQHMGDDFRCPHERTFRSKGFEPFFHYGIGEWVTGQGDIAKHMRPHWKDDYVIHLQEKR